ncbi:ABC transporter ATP-binding protein [Acuticoccus mangrovi]|uniref:ABC transporter ATP-binding protein n=1 Tax=Acuticoccus mangrovi TaxID=2796142 RepID=A0A934ITU8_9HYPH|nr:ABC transporter ATP-binding protein [Acuticoccus mangrovi]MBJ3778072.1 ABC transporter ATP-binding protein [Acuticoccus mangrovi]
MSGDRLEIDDISVQFEGIVALDHVSFALEPGQICGLIGPNGAGKTTLVNVITGFQRPTTGRIRLGSRDLTAARPELRSHLGIARTFQAVRLFRGFTVRENLTAYALGAEKKSAAAKDRAEAVLDWTRLSAVADRRADTLPYGVERRVGIARALAGDPRFLLLDEPAAGLNEEECDDLIHLIQEIPKHFGCAVLLIEHNMRVVMNVCDRICVIDFGKKIAEAAPHVIMKDPVVRNAYLGEEAL